jgi:hypothetical protein
MSERSRPAELSTVFKEPGAAMPDEQYIAEWTAMLAGRIESLL